jgi:sulfur-oxidizing protein SoxB
LQNLIFGTHKDSRTYRVAGWASVNQQQGKPVWEVVAKYLRVAKTLTLKSSNAVRLKDVAQNPNIVGAE